MIIYLSLLVALIGGGMYMLCANPKWATIGIVAFGCGLLTFLEHIASLPSVMKG